MKDMQRFVSHSESETRETGVALAKTYGTPGTLIAFSGDLGTGKTVLIRGICSHFGCEDQVTSPTFTIVNEYTAPEIDIVHCDLYRLGSIQEMLTIGLDDLFAQPRLFLVEWAEKALPILPVPRIEIAAHYGESETERIYTVTEHSDGMQSTLFTPDGIG